MRLDRRGDPILGSAGLDHVGVQRPLNEKPHVTELPCFLLEDANELLADDLSLLLRILDAGETRQEPLLRIDVSKRHMEVISESLDHLLGLVFAQEPVIGEPATTRAPAGGATTESRWLIHTVCADGRPSNSPQSSARSSVFPNSDAPVRSTEPPSSSASNCIP